MSLQYVFGSSGSGKSHYLYNNIIKESLLHEENSYILIVPEQFTMQTQRDLVSMHPNKGILNIDVLSFERLAYRVLEEVGGFERILLDDLGKSLILRKIAAEKQEELTVLGANLKKAGMIEEVKSVISEFIQYNIGLKELDSMIESMGDKGRLPYKLKDIRILYQSFLEYMEEKYITMEELLSVLCKAVDQSQIVKNSVIAFDGFTGFTPIQNQLIEKLLLYSKKVYITVTIDPKTDPYDNSNPAGLFHLSTRTIAAIEKLRIQNRIQKEEDIRFTDTYTYRYKDVESLSFLEQHIFRYPIKSFTKAQENVKIYCTKNPQEEVGFIASRIKKLIMEQGLRYRDIAVVTGDMERYSHYVERIFSDYEISYFLDKTRQVLLNPLIEFVRSVLEMIEDDFTYESVFHYLRSGVAGFSMENIDRMENYCLATGIRGRSKWNQKFIRQVKGITEEDLEGIEKDRKALMFSLEPLLESVKRKKVLVKEITGKLYEYMVSLDLEGQLAKLEKEFEEKKEYEKAKEYAGIYPIIMDLFDKMVALLGEEEMSIREYAEILDAGFAEAKVGIIPPTQDRVMVGDMERTRLKDIKVLFLMGVNDGIIPKGIQSGGILSDMDREQLSGNHFVLAPTIREQAYIQKFYLYLMLTKPEQKLYLSYSKTDNQGAGIRVSYLIGALIKLFPEITIRDIEKESTFSDHIITPDTGIRYLIEGLSDFKKDKAAKEWKELFKWYRNHEEYDRILNKIMQAAFYSYEETGIGKAVAKALYGNLLENSITRLECFSACAFKHFIKYGLNLKERLTYQFEPTDMGTIFHDSLDMFSKRLENKGYTWLTVTDEIIEEILEESVNESLVDYGNTVLYSTARNEYLIRRIKRILKRTVWGLKEQLKRGAFKPEEYEVAFHMVPDLNTATIQISEEDTLRLRGRIDRIDICEEDDKVYVKIIDYKSGTKSFDITAAYYGLELQLLVYMNAALEMEKKAYPGKEIIPAGLFYYRLSDPVIERNREEEEEETKERLMKELCMDGLVNSDKDIIRKLDNQITGKSKIIPVSLDKSGEISKASSVASTEQFNRISKYITDKMSNIGREIINGQITVNPYAYGKEEACTFCEYRAVCGFDENINGFRKRKLKKVSKEQLWAMLGEKEVEE